MKLYSTLHQKYNLNGKEIDQLLYVLKQWYCLNDDTDLFTPQTNKLLLKINTHNFKLPSALFRAYSFTSKEALNSFLKAAETKLKHPSKDYESWTSSPRVAEAYFPGGEFQLNKDSKYGVILKINRNTFQDHIKFSIENLFSGSQDKKIFFGEVFKYLSKDLLLNIKNGDLTKKDIQDFQHVIPGLVRAISEFEYLLEPIDYPDFTIYKITN